MLACYASRVGSLPGTRRLGSCTRTSNSKNGGNQRCTDFSTLHISTHSTVVHEASSCAFELAREALRVHCTLVCTAFIVVL